MDISIELQEELIKALSASKPFWESPFAIGLMTAFSVIAAAFIQKWQAHKQQERQSEIERSLKSFDLQMAALQSLSHIEHSITPNIEPYPGADSHEWLSPIVHLLHKVVADLDSFIKEHNYVCPPDVIQHVRAGIIIANGAKWDSMRSVDKNYEASKEETDAVIELISKISGATYCFKRELALVRA
jgi:hypothetical protein